jgi:hypothetical protein
MWLTAQVLIINVKVSKKTQNASMVFWIYTLRFYKREVKAFSQYFAKAERGYGEISEGVNFNDKCFF